MKMLHCQFANVYKDYAIRLSRIQLKFREISSCFILETDFRFEFLVQNMHVLRISSTYGKEKGHFD